MIEKFTLPYPAYTGEEERTVYVYLPDAFEENEKMRYPVLYMFDGHNVFLDEDATYGKSWGLGRYLDENEVPMVVVGVECTITPKAQGFRNMRLTVFRRPASGELRAAEGKRCAGLCVR